MTDEIVKLNMYTTPFIWFVNKDLWNKVSSGDQAIITELADTLSDMAKFHSIVDPIWFALIASTVLLMIFPDIATFLPDFMVIQELSNNLQPG